MNKPIVFPDTDVIFAGTASPTQHGVSHVVLRLGEITLQDQTTDTPAGRAVPSLAADWAQKPVSILAIAITFPEPPELEAPGFEPWTVAARWQQHIEAKVNGFGGLLLQRSPALLGVAFGLPRTLEQLLQRAVQVALAIRQAVAEAAGRAWWHRPGGRTGQ